MSAFRSFWFGTPPSPYERLAMQSFLDFGHSYTLYAYEKFDTPKGVELRDASEILPRNRVFVYKTGFGQGSVSAFSNIFRYRLLQQRGGWWVDADIVCLSDSIAEPDIFLGWEDEGKVGSAVLRFPAGHQVATSLYETAAAAGENVVWGQIGPKLVTETIVKAGLQDQVVAQARSFPIRARDALELLRPAFTQSVADRIQDAPLLHYWNEVMRRAVVFKWMAPPPESFMASLFRKHRVAPGAVVYAEDEIERLCKNFSATLQFLHREQLQSLRNALAAEQHSRKALEEDVRELREERDSLRLQSGPEDRSRGGLRDRLRQRARGIAYALQRRGSPVAGE